jgi:hypothetical protein
MHPPTNVPLASLPAWKHSGLAHRCAASRWLSAFAITETGTDLLCAMHLIWCAAREQIIAPLALLSRMPISQDALKSFRNKHICLFPHTDTPEEICNHWSDQLHEAGALAVEQYSFAELINPDGSPVQTLHDFLRIDAEVCLTHYDAIESAFLLDQHR